MKCKLHQSEGHGQHRVTMMVKTTFSDVSRRNKCTKNLSMPTPKMNQNQDPGQRRVLKQKEMGKGGGEREVPWRGSGEVMRMRQEGAGLGVKCRA